jgi:hypothetical protein
MVEPKRGREMTHLLRQNRSMYTTKARVEAASKLLASFVVGSNLLNMKHLYA